MEMSSVQLQAKLMREYYKYFSKYTRGKAPQQKVAWVTAFTPVEILEALDIAYFYPESYAAVIAASGKEQKLLEESEKQFLCKDCCSYSCCFEGSLALEEAPRGMPPKADILIATNNQCNTLPNWWNILAEKYNIPLIVLDYPGETANRERAYEYVNAQHEDLIAQLEQLSGNRLEKSRLTECIQNSKNSVAAWEKVIDLLPDHDIVPTMLFDAISFLITARCKSETAELYTIMGKELSQLPQADKSKVPVFWLGYPLWYHPKRYLSELLEHCKVVGSNYITWWNLTYQGESPFEQLFSAYNYTFLNLTAQSKQARLSACIEKSGARGAIVLHNKSCKCDFVSARQLGMMQVELEIDMIDREYLNIERAKNQLELFLENI